MNYESIGQNIKKYRRARKMTQEQLAKEIDRTESSIRKYEKGLTDIPAIVIERIAAALSISASALYGKDNWESIITHDATDELRAMDMTQKYNLAELEDYFDFLNLDGQQKLLELAEVLSKVPEYQKPPRVYPRKKKRG